MIDQIRGTGPSTGRSIGHYRRTGTLPDADPAQRPTNGAAMRMPPVGWMSPADDDDFRRELTRTVSIDRLVVTGWAGPAVRATELRHLGL